MKIDNVRFKIFQIDDENTDEKTLRNVMFQTYECAQPYLSKAYYNNVFEGTITIDTDDVDSALDDIYTTFNINRPEGFMGHSLSISDIIYIKDFGYYYACAWGWEKIDEKDFLH